MEWGRARPGGTAREPCADPRKLAAGPVSAILSELHFGERDTASRVVRLVFVYCQIAAPQRTAAQCLVSRVPSVRRCVTVREMKEGPSRPAVRCRPQTAASCCRQKRW